MDPLIAVLVALILAGALSSSSSGRSSSLPRRVLLVGDSLAVGLAGPLEQAARADGAAFAATVKGGTTTRHWASGSQSARLRAALELGPDLVLVCLGTNDAASGPSAYRPDAAALVALLRADGRRVVWILPPILPAHFDAATVRATVAGLGVDTFDSERLTIPRFDGIHATPAGYRYWAGEIWAAVRR